MTQPISLAEDAGSWNPAFRPEHITPQIPATMTEDSPSDTLANESAPEPSKPDVKSPLSDDDFSAWDIPEDKVDSEPQPTSLDSVMAEVTQGSNANGDNVQDDVAANLDSADATTTTSSQDHLLEATNDDAAPANPDSDAVVESQHTQPSEPDTIFASTDDSVDFSELLASGTDAEQSVNQPPEPVEKEPVFETIPEAPAQEEASQLPPQPVENAQLEPSSIDAVFASSEENDDFSALLSADAEPAPVPQDAEPVESTIPFNGAQSEQIEDLSTAPEFQLPVDEAPVPQASQINTESGFPNESTSEESLKSIDQGQQILEAPLSSTTANNASQWMNQEDVEMDSDGDDFFNQLKTQTKPIFAPPEAESRFEEGVPLLEEDGPDSPDRAMFDDDASNDLFGGDHDDDPEGFFSSSKRPEVTEQPTMHITRKSTSQVMESVGFDIASPASDISAAAQFDDVIKAATSDPQENQEQSSAPSTAPAPAEDDLAARWEAELSDAEEEDLAARWEAALDLDDIDDEEDATQATKYVPQSPLHTGPAALNSPFETPQQRQTPPRPIPGVYAPHQPSTAHLVGGVGFPGAPPQNSSVPPYYAQQPPNPVNSRGESFAERSKEGYKSPYDLPDDLSRPRRPILTHKPGPKVDNSMPPPPPPGSGSGQYIGSAGAPPFAAAIPSAPASSAAPVAPPPAPKNFFEELPMPAPRSRPASSGRYTPNPTVTATGPSTIPPPQNPYATIPAPPLAPQPPVVPPTGLPAAPPVADFPAHSSLEPPERLDPYGSTGHLASSAPSAPIATSRYSPKPPGLQPSGKPASSPRYSPAPPPVPAGGRSRYASQPLSVPGQGANMPFQPRTSSPLAYHEKVSYQPNEAQQMPPPSLQPSVDLSPPRQRPSVDQGSPYAPQLSNGSPYAAGGPQIPQQTPPKPPYAPQEYLDEFTKRMTPTSNYAPAPAPPMVPDIQPSQPLDSGVVSPRRSQTQSPGQQQLTSPRAFVPPIETMPRPASVHGSSSPTKTVNPYAPQQAANRARAASKASQQLEFIVPTDGQEQDPLGRWKGAPIFKFGFGGSVVSCFPKHIPRYSAGIPAPMIKPTLGEPRYSHLDSWLPSGDTIVPHPGPLKVKSKKKDVLAWLSSKIAAFENEETPGFNNSQPDARVRHEEKILLWKMTKILVENDGTLEGSPEIQKSLRQVIFPGLSESQSDGSYGNSFAAPGGAQPFGLPSQADSVDSQWSQELRTNLLLGEREKAVWGAVDRRLWGHAMIIASTMEKSIWKQVVQEYVRREVRSPSGGTESLAALYEIFAGNVEESIDELVPPSARAGHHLISKADGQGTSKNALAGLESWRDTLGLVLSNRSSDDHQALLALGHLLASYGRIEAAHICFIFSRSVVFGGADDPQANIVLLGADHQRLPCTLLDEDAILLTEIYEFATSVLANSPTANLPHLLAFKLLHAKYLADRGRKTEAQNYCDSLATSLKSTTRPSPYHHQYLFAEIDELSARLRQTASDGNSSWISKPSMEKVSGSMWARFNSFVAGDESDAASNGSGKAPDAPEFGPFANVAGTPTVSRSPSMSDMYGSYPGAGAQPIPAGGSSKYLPSSQYAPTASPDQVFRGRSSMDSQRSTSGGLAFGQRRLSQEPETPVDSMFQNPLMYGSPGSVGYQPTPPQSSYVPLAPVREDATQSPADVSQPAVNGLFYQPPGSSDGPASQSPFYQGPPGMPQAESSSYMPPAVANSYAPPSYAPDVNIAPEQSEYQEEEEKPRKKAFMDDDGDEDLAARASALKISQKQENDRKADEAFRKAAEEDEKRAAAQQGQKKGWFGGWFGGAPKKEPDNVGGGPIKAKLGEENSFYYDNDLKKWVNKKDPGSGTAARATPPPPRGSAPPSRASSGSMPPPPAPMSAASGSRPPSSSSDAAPLSSSPAFAGLTVPPPMPRSVSSNAALSSSLPGSSSGLAPPRPASSLSHAQSIDDLLGAPTARKGGTVRGKKKGRYVDVMAK
ncbi:hypothetical protein N7456_006557 [Penicillium angulare]|uniref:Protein transport protein sec16 n=1 Tax=Penicillium angulare TaxID=116970 RepID=A0A9W9FHV3_9EURO|nr:hypothetical protein N7456_006557 [Penicillium angulare]